MELNKYLNLHIPKSIYDVVVYLVLGFLPLSVNFILAPIYTGVFAPAEYALLGLAGVFLNFFSVFVALGLQGAATRFYFYHNTNQSDLRALFSTILLLILIISLVLSVCLHFWGDSLFRFFITNEEFTYSKYGFWILITSAFSVLNAIMLSFYRNEEKVGLFAVVSLSFFLMSLLGNLLGVFYFDMGVYGSIAGRSIGGVTASLPFIFIFLKKGKFAFYIKFLLPLFKYALPLVPYGLLMMLYEGIDKILLERFFGLEDLGAYTLAYQVASITSIFIFALFNATSPKINKLLNQETINTERISMITNGFLVMSLGFIVFFVAIAGYLVEVFINESYHQIIEYLPILILSYVGRIFYLIFSLFLLFYHRNNSLNYITAGSILLGVFVSYSLYERLGILSIYVAVLVIKVSQCAFSAIYVIKYKDFNIAKLAVVKTLILAIIFLLFAVIPTLFLEVYLVNSISLLPLLLYLVYLLHRRKFIKNLSWFFRP